MASDSTRQEFFHATPALIPLFQALGNAMEARHLLVTLRIQKSQIAFCAPRAFCYVWLPSRWMHHVITGSVADIDDELFAWIDQAYHWRNRAL